MRKFKFVAMICALILCIGSMSACASDTRTPLYVLHFKTEYSEYYDWFNDYFEEKYPDVRVEYTAVPTSDFNSAFDSRVQSGMLDVFGAQPSTMLQGIYAYMEPLEHMDVMDDYQEQYLKMGQMYNEELGESEQLTMPLDYVGCVVFYNKDMFEEYGWEIPTTYSGFIALCEEICAASQDAVGQIGKTKIAQNAPLLMGGKDQWPLFSVLDAVEGQVVQGTYPGFYDRLKTENYTNLAEYQAIADLQFDSDVWVETYTKTQEIGEYFQSTFSGLAYDSAPRYFAKGDGITKEYYPMMIDGSWSYGDIMNKDPDFEVGMFVLPATEDPEKNDNFAYKGGVSFSVFKESQNKDIAQAYIELHLSDEAYTKYLEYTRLPSVLTTIEQQDEAVNELFDSSKYDFVPMYDSAVIKYMPIPSAYELMSLIQKNTTPNQLASDVQGRVEADFDKWYEFKSLRN